MIEHIFPTPIYYHYTEEDVFDQLQDEITTFLKSVNFYQNEMQEHGMTKWITTDTFHEDIISEAGLNLLSSEIDRHLTNYCNELGFQKVPYKRTSWISIFNSKDSLVSHNHGHEDIAGIYYYSGGEDAGKLYFESPVPAAVASLCYRNYVDRWSHHPIPGKFILFPGWMTHGIFRNFTDITRVSIPFNISFSRHLNLNYDK